MSDKKHERARLGAAELEHAERILSGTYRIGLNERILLDRADVDHLSYAQFVSQHRETLFRKYLPDVDPRAESSVVTMMTHFFLVGVIAGGLRYNDRDLGR